MVLALRGWRGPGWWLPGEVGEVVGFVGKIALAVVVAKFVVVAVIVDVGNDGQSMAMVV